MLKISTAYKLKEKEYRKFLVETAYVLMGHDFEIEPYELIYAKNKELLFEIIKEIYRIDHKGGE